MIKGIWKTIELVCGNNHPIETPMTIQEGPLSMFYACPKYHNENRSENERACTNRIKLDDYEKMVNKICDILSEGEIENKIIDLTGYEWSARGVHFKVLKHTKNKIKIEMTNKKAIG